MKRLLLVLCLLFSLNAKSQCVFNQSSTLFPPGPYQPGDVVTASYMLGYFYQLNVNWIIAFQINLGPGWTNLQPLTPPPTGTGTQTGFWIWDNQNVFPSGLIFGPGWRFINTTWWGNPDWGSDSNGPFTVSFRIVVGQTCTADNLLISINVFGDCLTGGWNNGVCCVDPPHQIYNGVVQITPILTSNINHY